MGACSSLTCKTGSPNISPAASQNPLPLPPPGLRGHSARHVEVDAQETLGPTKTGKQEDHRLNELFLQGNEDKTSAEILRRAHPAPISKQNTLTSHIVPTSESSSLSSEKRQEIFHSLETPANEGEASIGVDKHIPTDVKPETQGEIEIPISIVEDTSSDTSEILRALSELDRVLPTDSEDDITGSPLEEGSCVRYEQRSNHQSDSEEHSEELKQLAKSFVDQVVKEASQRFREESQQAERSNDLDVIHLENKTEPETKVVAEDNTVAHVPNSTAGPQDNQIDFEQITTGDSEKQKETEKSHSDELNEFVSVFVDGIVKEATKEVHTDSNYLPENIDLESLEITLPEPENTFCTKDAQFIEKSNELNTDQVPDVVEPHSYPSFQDTHSAKNSGKFTVESITQPCIGPSSDSQDLNKFVEDFVGQVIKEASEKLLSESSPTNNALSDLEKELTADKTEIRNQGEVFSSLAQESPYISENENMAPPQEMTPSVEQEGKQIVAPVDLVPAKAVTVAAEGAGPVEMVANSAPSIESPQSQPSPALPHQEMLFAEAGPGGGEIKAAPAEEPIAAEQVAANSAPIVESQLAQPIQDQPPKEEPVPEAEKSGVTEQRPNEAATAVPQPPPSPGSEQAVAAAESSELVKEGPQQTDEAVPPPVVEEARGAAPEVEPSQESIVATEIMAPPEQEPGATAVAEAAQDTACAEEPEGGSTSSDGKKEESKKESKEEIVPFDFHKLKQFNLILKLQKEMAIMQVRMGQLQDCMRAATHALSDIMDHCQPEDSK